MKSLVITFFFATLAATNGIPSTTVVQGPSAKTMLVGNDESVISSVAPGGTVIAEEQTGIVAKTLPVVSASPAVTSPYVVSPALFNGVTYTHPAPVVAAYSTPVVNSYVAPVVSAYSGPLVSGYAALIISHSFIDSDVAGPSGTIATSKSAEGHVSTHRLYL